MSRTTASGLALCIAFLAPLGLEARADPIQMTATGDAGFGPVNFSHVVTASDFNSGYDVFLGSRIVGPSPSGSFDTPISLNIRLTDAAAPGSQGLTLSLSGSLTGQFFPWDKNYGDPGVAGIGTITAITVSGRDPTTKQVVSATIQGPNGMLSSAALARFSSIGSIPQPLFALLAKPGEYSIQPSMGGGVEGLYYATMWIAPPSPGDPVPAPEPTPLALLGLAAGLYLARRAPLARKAARSRV